MSVIFTSMPKQDYPYSPAVVLVVFHYLWGKLVKACNVWALNLTYPIHSGEVAPSRSSIEPWSVFGVEPAS